MTGREARTIVNSRLAEVGLAVDRFVVCQSGEKKCLDHDNRQSEPPAQNYGIYTTAADRLVVLDIDDYKEGGDSSGVAALAKLPPTLETKSPHGGTHRFYAVEATDEGKLPAAALKEEFGAANPIPSFGEVIVKNKYVVGAGSQLSGCKKDWCDDCATAEGGRYVVQADRPVAEITAEQLIEALRPDPDLSHRDDESEDLTEYEGGQGSSSTPSTSEPDIEYDDELSREQVEEALEHVDNRLHYDDWIRVGFAVYDWDDGATGKQVFEEWSRQSPKWVASEGQPHIDDIWSGSPNGHVSVGTLVHYAKQGGWEPPRGRPKTHVDGDLVTAEAAADQLEHLLERYATDEDDEIPGERQEEIGRLIGAVTDEDYDELRGRAQAVLDTSGDVLDEHRRLMEYYLDDGPVLVENGSTYYLSGTPLYRQEICNFELEVESFLTVPDEPEQAEVRVRYAGEEFEKFVAGKLFKERQRFEDDLASERLGMTFDTQGHPTQSILDELNEYVASRDAPRRRGTHHMGLHEGEFVTPAGSLTEEGWTDDPEYVYLDRDLGIERNVSLPSDSAEFDADDVVRIVEDLPYTRDVSRFLPVLGWFYAAPFRPHIEDQEGSFNLLNVTGDTGSGKTTSLRYLWRCFGMTGEPFDARDTWFVLLSTFAATNSIPVWHDEYKPSDMTKREVDRFHDAIRKTATGSTAQRGNADKSTTEYHLRAPSVVSGEQQIQPPAERRRSIMVNFRTSVTQEGTGTRRRFKNLVGSGIVEDGELLLPDDAPDPTNHALAYYRYVASQSQSDFHEVWLDARERVWEVRESWDGEYTLDDMEIQGLQTVVFGWRMLHSFAEEVGADVSALPGETELKSALRHVAEAIGPDGSRKSHLDRFVELLERAAAAEYVEEGVDYKFVKEGKADEELRIKVDRAYDKVSKYARDHGLDTEDLLDAAAYKDRFKTAAEEDGGYVTKYGQYTPPLSRCVGVSTLKAMNKLEFDRMTFGVEPMDSHKSAESGDDGDGDGDGGADAGGDPRPEGPPPPSAGADESSPTAAADGGAESGLEHDPDADPTNAEYAAQKACAVVRHAGSPLSKTKVVERLGSRFEIPPKVGRRGVEKAIRRGGVIEGEEGLTA